MDTVDPPVACDNEEPFELVLWHNPLCSKSRAVKEILIERGVPHRERRYLEDFPQADELKRLAAKVGKPLETMVRKDEQPWTELGFDLHVPDSTTLATAIAQHPILLERPVLEDREGGIIGRPPESVMPWLMARGHLHHS